MRLLAVSVEYDRQRPTKTFASPCFTFPSSYPFFEFLHVELSRCSLWWSKSSWDEQWGTPFGGKGISPRPTTPHVEHMPVIAATALASVPGTAPPPALPMCALCAVPPIYGPLAAPTSPVASLMCMTLSGMPVHGLPVASAVRTPPGLLVT